MRSCIYSSIFLLTFLMPVIGKGQVIAPAESLQISVDLAQFRGADDKTTDLEIYYAFPRRSLTYKADTAGFTGMLDLTLLITRNDTLILADRWLVPHVLRDTAIARRGMNLVGSTAVALSEGTDNIKLIGRDRHNPLRTDSVSMRVHIGLMGTQKVAISDIELASNIRQGVKGGPFYKNTLEVVPNVTGIYGESQRCMYYAEVYNLLAGDDRSDYTIRTTVLNALGKEIISRDKPKKRTVESIVFFDGFDASVLRSGTYTLGLVLLDSLQKPLCGSVKKFFVYNPTLGVDSTVAAASAAGYLGVYTSMEEPELDREFRWARWEAKDDERKAYEELKGVAAKRKFLADFWKKRGPEKRREYLERVAYVNSTYSSLTCEGYRTDRGRVYIVYGPPDDYDRHPYESDMRPYEVWSYNSLEGGVIFVFVQRLPAGDYELVHSTERSEIHDENWNRTGITN